MLRKLIFLVVVFGSCGMEKVCVLWMWLGSFHDVCEQNTQIQRQKVIYSANSFCRKSRGENAGGWWFVCVPNFFGRVGRWPQRSSNQFLNGEVWQLQFEAGQWFYCAVFSSFAPFGVIFQLIEKLLKININVVINWICKSYFCLPLLWKKKKKWNTLFCVTYYFISS